MIVVVGVRKAWDERGPQRCLPFLEASIPLRRFQQPPRWQQRRRSHVGTAQAFRHVVRRQGTGLTKGCCAIRR